LGTIRKFEELEAWKHARALVQEVYSLTAGGRFAKEFGLRDQIRRASVSIMANIAEGYERDGNAEFIHFLSIAKGSAGEVRYHLYIARDQDYLNQDKFDEFLAMTQQVSRIIRGLISYLQKTEVKGNKFQFRNLET
jgi:four helix bundle protein